MRILKANQKDVEWINGIIKKEFPYTNFTPKKISEKISNKDYLIITAKDGKDTIGFAEVEYFFDEKKARLNGIFVRQEFRKKGAGKKMTNYLAKKAKEKKINELFLLVKKENAVAKKLYESTGMIFDKIHDKKIEKSVVEVWKKDI